MKTLNRLIPILIILFSTVVLNAQEERWGPVSPRKVEEFKFSTPGYVKMMLDSFFTDLANNPSDQGHIIIYPKTESQRRGIEKIIAGQFKMRNFDRTRVTLVAGPINADGIVQFWSVSPGADDPKPILGEETPGKLKPKTDIKDGPNPYGDGIGRGSGDGTIKSVPGAGMAPRNDPNPVLQSPNPPIPTPDQPFRVLSKSPARYNKLARSNQVQGTVELRITFLANGRIGTITPVKTLPDGLTDQAVNAARLIRFQPEIKNGVAINTTKVLSYSFNIY